MQICRHLKPRPHPTLSGSCRPLSYTFWFISALTLPEGQVSKFFCRGAELRQRWAACSSSILQDGSDYIIIEMGAMHSQRASGNFREITEPRNIFFSWQKHCIWSGNLRLPLMMQGSKILSFDFLPVRKRCDHKKKKLCVFFSFNYIDLGNAKFWSKWLTTLLFL